MSYASRIAKNTLVLILSSVANLILSFFYTAYTARYLGAQGYGAIAYAIALTGIFSSLMDLGLNQLAIREISRDHSLVDKYAFNMASIKLFLVSLTVILIAVAANLIGKGDRTSITIVYILAISAGLTSFSGIFSSAFQSFEKMEYSSFGNVLNGLCMLSGALIAIRLGFSVLGFAYIYLIASILVFSYYFMVYVVKFFKNMAPLDMGLWVPMLREALPFGLAGLFTGIFGYISSVILSYSMGNEAVGWYNASYRLIAILAIVPSVINISLFPVMCRLYVTSKDMMRFVQKKSLRYMILLGLPIGVGATITADKIINLIFGPDYNNSVFVLRILIWSSVLVYTSSSFSRLLSTSNRQMTVTKVMAICALVNILLNLLLIPVFSYVGASLASVATEMTSLILSMMAANRMGYNLSREDLVFIARVIVACAVMGVFTLYMRSLNLFLLIAFSAILYFAASYFLRVFDKDDIIIFRNILHKSA